MILDFVEIIATIGIMFGGYFVFRILEAMIIGSWNYPTGWYLKYLRRKNEN